jgi:hypothetical protein
MAPLTPKTKALVSLLYVSRLGIDTYHVCIGKMSLWVSLVRTIHGGELYWIPNEKYWLYVV